MTKESKLLMVIDAALKCNFTDGIDDIDVLEYSDKDGKTMTDRFDYIDTTTIPVTVCFIGGTGFDNPRIPINFLTEDSVERLYSVINK